MRRREAGMKQEPGMKQEAGMSPREPLHAMKRHKQLLSQSTIRVRCTAVKDATRCLL
jgi:hypothetical protein